MKYIILICVFLAVESLFMFSMYKGEKERRIALENEKNTLIQQVEDFNNAQVQASNTIQKIQEKVKYIKSPCNCYRSNIDPSLLAWVRGDKK